MQRVAKQFRVAEHLSEPERIAYLNALIEDGDLEVLALALSEIAELKEKDCKVADGKA